MRNSAAAIANATYHIYLVAKAGGADPDIYAHTSASASTVVAALQAETGGASYTIARRIGSIMREGGAIVAFTQYGDVFERTGAPVLDVFATNPGTSGVIVTASVPVGIVVEWVGTTTLDVSGTGTQLYVSSLVQTDLVVDGDIAQTAFSIGGVGQLATPLPSIRTDTSARFRYRLSASSASISVRLKTKGWIDRRGKDA
jgi:hypothetical protein